MRYLGIDFGLSHLGLSFAEGPLVEPLGQKTYQSLNQLLSYLVALVKKHQINKIVIGITEGNMAQKTIAFADQLKAATSLPVVFQDETLSTHEAKIKLIQAGAPQKKRRRNHQAAAAIILQTYLDTQVTA